MRIVLDMQGAQSSNQFSEGGHYNLSLAEALVQNRGEHEIILALNGLFPESIIPIRERFKDILPQENIRVWYSIDSVEKNNKANETNRKVAELVREAFISSLRPDVIHIFDLEGYANNTAASLPEVQTEKNQHTLLEEIGNIQYQNIQWNTAANRLLDNFSKTYTIKSKTENSKDIFNSLIDQLSENHLIQKHRLPELAYALEKTFVDINKAKQLFVDISDLVHRDIGTGVQRVTKSILNELIKKPPANYVVTPVYATAEDSGYRHANKFISKTYGGGSSKEDTPIECRPGDLFLGLDLQHLTIIAQEKYLTELSQYGVKIYFVIYDMLPIFFPQFWPPEHAVKKAHEEWLKVISKYDGAICISKSVANQFTKWLSKQDNTFVKKSFSVNWFHLGADISNTIVSKGTPENSGKILSNLKSHTSFLMVGTIEPRKAHAQTLQAFDQLWEKGLNHKLIIVGKRGWLVDSLIDKIRQHPQLNHNLFWLEGISDEFLEQIYAASSCLIAASYGEGFGLPLIEAAQHQVPIIARDIPVFREVAGEHAYFFTDTENPNDIATTIVNWKILHDNNQHPKSNTMPWLSWNKSAQQLMQTLLGR